jgi:hypothetical protein
MPHRVGHLFEKIATRENVVGAWEDYNRNRPISRRREIDDAEVDSILSELSSWTFDFGKPREKDIWECGKVRHLKIPSFRSAIAQYAVFRVINPIIDNRLPEMSMSSRRGRGGHLLAKKVNRKIRTDRKGSAFALYFDIRKFYDHIRIDDAISALSRIVKDEKVISLVTQMFAPCGNGLPIGYVGAHMLANLVGAEIFRRLRQFKGVTYGCVYMDNFHFFARSRAPLHRLQNFAVKVLAEYGMEMKPDWQIFPVWDRGVRIAGIVVKPRGTNGLYHRTFRRMMAAINRAFNRPNNKSLNSAMSYLGWLMATGRTRMICDRIKKEKMKCTFTLIRKLALTN